jgi:hypothetical protein
MRERTAAVSGTVDMMQGRNARRVGVGVALVLACVAPAHADNYFADTHYELGYQSIQDLAFDGGVASGGGLHLTEHNGVVSRLPYMAIYVMADLMDGGDTKAVGTVKTETHYDRVDYVDERGNVVTTRYKPYEVKVVNVTYVPLTAEERKARDENLENLGKTLATIASMPSHFELMYMPQRDNGRLRGIRGALYPVSVSIGRHVEIALGYAGARLHAEYSDPASGMTRTIKYRSRAVGVRFGVAPVRWFVVTAEVQPNLLDIDDSDGRYGTTVRGTAAVSIPTLDRFYAKLGTERTGFLAGGAWSTFFEAGLRF